MICSSAFLTAAATAPPDAQARPALAKREPGKLPFGSGRASSSLVSSSECVSNIAEQSPGNDCTWPALTVQLPTTYGCREIHSRRRQIGRPLYVAMLPMVASSWLTLDDPQPTYAAPNWTPET